MKLECPYCEHVAEADDRLKPGDFSVCIECTQIIRFTENAEYRRTTADDFKNISEYERDYIEKYQKLAKKHLPIERMNIEISMVLEEQFVTTYLRNSNNPEQGPLQIAKIHVSLILDPESTEIYEDVLKALVKEWLKNNMNAEVLVKDEE